MYVTTRLPNIHSGGRLIASAGFRSKEAKIVLSLKIAFAHQNITQPIKITIESGLGLRLLALLISAYNINLC
jgi:hypothetical protein